MIDPCIWNQILIIQPQVYRELGLGIHEYFHHIVQHLINFCAVDLSALYLDIVKDRLYCCAPASPERRAAQTALYDILDTLVRLMAPILSFMAEEVWSHLPGDGRAASPLLAGFPEETGRDEALAARWERLLSVRTAVTKALEDARQADRIGHSLDARVVLEGADALRSLLDEAAPTLPALFIVSQVEFGRGLGTDAVSPLLPELKVRVERARGAKCERCWNYNEHVGSDATHPGLCDRCLPVVHALGA